MALIIERLGVVTGQYCKYLSAHCEVGFVNFSQNQGVLLGHIDQESPIRTLLLKKPSTHVIIAPKSPIRSTEELNLMAARVTNGFMLVETSSALEYHKILAKDKDRTLRLPEAHFFPEQSEESEDVNQIDGEMVHTTFYPNIILAREFANYREVQGNKLLASPRSDLDWLESRLYGRFYREWKNPVPLNGNGRLSEGIVVNGTNGYINGALVLARS